MQLPDIAHLGGGFSRLASRPEYYPQGVLGSFEIGLQLHGSAKIRDGPVDITALLQCQPEITECNRIIRHEPGSLTKFVQCAGVIALPAQSDADAFPCRAEAWINSGRASKLGKRLLQVTMLAEGDA